MTTIKDLEEKIAKTDSNIDKILGLLESRPTAPAVAPTKEEKAIAEAAPNKYTTNPEWEKVAEEILGDYLDHTEVEHEKTGGIKFTVVVKIEKSNAGQEYLSITKVDRRTKEVGALGLDGVTEWCKLIRQNLKKSESK
jgi:hypothetical protein